MRVVSGHGSLHFLIDTNLTEPVANSVYGCDVQTITPGAGLEIVGDFIEDDRGFFPMARGVP